MSRQNVVFLPDTRYRDTTENADSLYKIVGDLGTPSPFTCPECNGVLLQMKASGTPRFRCHTGHAFSVQSLLANLTEEIENNLWSSACAMQESILLMRRLAQSAHEARDQPTAATLEQKAQDTERRVGFIRQALADHEKQSRAKLQHPDTKKEAQRKISPSTPSKRASRRPGAAPKHASKRIPAQKRR